MYTSALCAQKASRAFYNIHHVLKWSCAYVNSACIQLDSRLYLNLEFRNFESLSGKVMFSDEPDIDTCMPAVYKP